MLISILFWIESFILQVSKETKNIINRIRSCHVESYVVLNQSQNIYHLLNKKSPRVLKGQLRHFIFDSRAYFCNLINLRGSLVVLRIEFRCYKVFLASTHSLSPQNPFALSLSLSQTKTQRAGILAVNGGLRTLQGGNFKECFWKCHRFLHPHLDRCSCILDPTLLCKPL